MFHCVVWLWYHCSVELPLRVELICVALTYQVFIATSTLIGTYTDACTHAQHQFSNSHANVITPLTLNSLNTRWDVSIQIRSHSHELLNTNVTQLLSATAFKKRLYTCNIADEAWYWPNMSCAVVVSFPDPPPKRKGEFGNKTSTHCKKGTFLHILVPSWQLAVSMHQIGSLICNKYDKLMVKMTILF